MRRRILLLVVGMTTLVVVAFAIPMAFLIRSTAGQESSRATTDEAQSISLYLRNSTRTKAQLTTYVADQSSSSGRPVSITLPDGTVVGHTPADSISVEPGSGNYGPGSGAFGGFGANPFSSGSSTGGYSGSNGADPDGNGQGRDGQDGDRGPRAQLIGAPDGQVAVAFAPANGGRYVIRVYLSDDDRYSGAASEYWLLGGAALVLILLGALAGEVLTRRIVRPLVKSAATAQQLARGDTAARAPTDGPAEVADVGRALNRLADRIDQLIAEERETVADLSHRLRTPLTALRLDAEALRDPAEAERVGVHVSALERMLTAVIHAARRPQREGRMPSADATEVVRDRVAFWSALAEDQGRHGAVELPDAPLSVRAAPEDLAAAVDALLENVIAHTPEGVDFAVRLHADDGVAVLEVSDGGPGLPADAHVRGRSDRGSTGLGLDIARRCAEASGGSMTLASNAAGGALVVLRLGSS